MAVAFDASMTGGNSSDGLDQNVSAATSISSTGMTTGGSASLLVAVFEWQNSTADITGRSSTWNSVSSTEGPSILQTSGARRNRVSIFTLVSPASGNKTLAGAWTTASDCYMSCASFTGTDTTTGIQTADSTTASGTTTITVTSDANGATVAVFGVDGATPTVNFTKIFAEAPLNPGGGASYTLGGTSNGHTFTGAGGTIQSLAGVHVIAAAATQSPCMFRGG